MFPFLPLSSIFLFLHCEGLSVALVSSGLLFSVTSGRAFSGLRTIPLSSFSFPYSPCTLHLEPSAGISPHTSHDAPGSTSANNFSVTKYRLSSAFKPNSVLNGYKVTNGSGMGGGGGRKGRGWQSFSLLLLTNSWRSQRTRIKWMHMHILAFVVVVVVVVLLSTDLFLKFLFHLNISSTIVSLSSASKCTQIFK